MEAMRGIRDSFGQAMLELGEENKNVVALVSDSKFSSKLAEFEKRFPDRFFELGIAEQNMIGVAAGLALSGKIVFASAIACFASMRCFEQVRTDIAYPKLNVKVVGMSSGFAYPQLGATHTCVEDVSIMRAISNLAVIAPADGMETFKAIKAIADYKGPVYLRLGRHPVPALYDKSYEFTIGKAVKLREGKDISIISVGTMVHISLEAAKRLEKRGVKAAVINMPTMKPIDEDAIEKAARATGKILTVEEHNLAGGLGSATAEVVVQKCPVPMKMMGIPNETPPPGPRDELLKRYGLTVASVVKECERLVRTERIH